MLTDIITGNNLQLKPAEEQCPYTYWIAWLKNFADSCIEEYRLKRKVGRKYSAVDFWAIIILHVVMNLSFDEASDRLNTVLWRKRNLHRRNKIYPKKYNGKYRRKERLCPNGDQVRKYRNTLPSYLINNLNRTIFLAQIRFAQKQKLFGKTIDLLVDNTDQWYYGNDRFPENPFITKGYNGPGTNRKRKYLALMLRSGPLSLFVGFHLIQKQHSNDPKILELLDWLTKEGISIRSVLGDRWFPTFGLLSGLRQRKICYVGPYKKYARIKRKLKDYLINGGSYIFKYHVKGNQQKFYGQNPVELTCIITNAQGRRLREIREDYLRGGVTLKDSLKEFMVIVTTHPHPHKKKAKQCWAINICERYHRRWQIETGFRDCNRLGPPSNARTNDRKFFMESVRLWLYNLWQIERAKRKKLRESLRSWKHGPTLRRFSFIQLEAYKVQLIA